MSIEKKPAPNAALMEISAARLHVIYGILLSVICAVDLLMPLGVAVGVLYLVVVLLTLWTPHNKTTLFIAGLSSLLIIAVYFYKPPVDYMWKAMFNRGISLFSVWSAALLGLQKNRMERQRNVLLLEREKALQEVRILRGFLPICASCKKIRDDNGYWTQIEGYIKEHSEAEFTHSICPDCVKRLYPDLYKQN